MALLLRQLRQAHRVALLKQPILYRPELAGSYLIAIRLESPTTGYYAYNWFYNNTFVPGQDPQPPISGYQCCPYFFIQSVVRNQSVTINAYNFPPNDSFVVTMGPYGSYGVGGYVVATTTTDGDGTLHGNLSGSGCTGRVLYHCYTVAKRSHRLLRL